VQVGDVSFSCQASLLNFLPERGEGFLFTVNQKDMFRIPAVVQPFKENLPVRMR
jgi:hypothetical protein